MGSGAAGSWPAATGMEVLLGLALLVGFKARVVAQLSGTVLLLFAGGLTAGTGIKTAFDASVVAAARAAFALARLEKAPS